MTKSTNHHPAATRGPRASAAHKVWAQQRMNRGSSHEQHLRGHFQILHRLRVASTAALHKPQPALTPTKVAMATRQALRDVVRSAADFAAGGRVQRGSARGG